jgi:hypothetical protein
LAGDWIKIEHSLPGKPEVMRLASRLGIDEMAVVGHLVIFWSWVDQNLSPDCPAAIGTNRGLDRVVGRDGFVDAMIEVGWLSFSDGKVEIPNYDHHLSESAKKRALEARKKHRQRNSSRKCPDGSGTNVPMREGQKGGPEKRREEKSNKEIKRGEEFEIAFGKWRNHLAQLNKPLTESTEDATRMALGYMSDEKAVEKIMYSIEGGYARLYEPKVEKPTKNYLPEPSKKNLYVVGGGTND